MTAEANRRGIVDAARAALYEHGIDIRAPWDCDLDDLELERFNGLNAAVDAIVAAALTPPQTEPGGTVREAAIAGWNACRKSIYAVCEDAVTENEKHREDTENPPRHHFGRGGMTAAKSIARGFNSMEAEDDDNLVQALAALSATPATEARVDGWQDISTAPMDGTWVELYRAPPTSGFWACRVTARWHHFGDGEWAWAWPDEVYEIDTEDGRSRADRLIEDGDCWEDGENFTHWRPLSAPPPLTQPEARDVG